MEVFAYEILDVESLLRKNKKKVLLVKRCGKICKKFWLIKELNEAETRKTEKEEEREKKINVNLPLLSRRPRETLINNE